MPSMDRQQEFVLRTLEERDIRFVRLWFTDVSGYLKAVAVAPAAFALVVNTCPREVTNRSETKIGLSVVGLLSNSYARCVTAV